jgi:hypothetical protein
MAAFGDAAAAGLRPPPGAPAGALAGAVTGVLANHLRLLNEILGFRAFVSPAVTIYIMSHAPAPVPLLAVFFPMMSLNA